MSSEQQQMNPVVWWCENHQLPGGPKECALQLTGLYDEASDGPCHLIPGVFVANHHVDCGADLAIRAGVSNWLIICTQDPDHPGPHVGLISWPTLPQHTTNPAEQDEQ